MEIGDEAHTVPGFDRITSDPDVMGGRACIRDTRVAVSMILTFLGNGMTPDEIVAAYPYLELEDIRQALLYEVWRAAEGNSSQSL